MSKKPTYEELEQRFKEIEKTVVELKSEKKNLSIMQNAVASSINAIGITDLQGKMIYVNDACIKMWGYDHENEILGRSLSEFWEGDGIFNTIKELQEKGVASGDDIGKRKDGSLFNVQFSANIFKDEVGNPAYMFGSFFDIT
nr:PAS domain-containing protein [Deltaproteobacteria bacterium]